MEYVNYDEKMLQAFEYETTIQSDNQIVGVCELGKAKIQLLNENNNYSDFKGKWLKTIHGSFYIHDIKPVQEKVNIELSCYDIRYKLDTKYNSSKHNFPCTLKEWRNSIFDDCGASDEAYKFITNCKDSTFVFFSETNDRISASLREMVFSRSSILPSISLSMPAVFS